MAEVDDEILAKSGAELFKELLRVYSTAEVEDYYRMGQWRDDVLRLDIQLFYSHAREAGAPYPPPLEKVKLPPNMPRAPMVRPATALGKAAAALKPPGAVGALAAAKAGTLLPGKAGMAKAGAAAAPEDAGTPAAAGTGMAAELRLIALFVAKWKLDPTKTKLMLAKLPSPRRRYVIAQFKAINQNGEQATESLEQFIKKCDAENLWPAGSAAAAPAATATNGAATTPGGMMTPGAVRPAGARPVGAVGAKAAATPKAGLTPPANGVKRPLLATNPMFDPAKRPRAITPKAGLMTPTTPGAVRPRAPGAVNPGLRGTLLQPRY